LNRQKFLAECCEADWLEEVIDLALQREIRNFGYASFMFRGLALHVDVTFVMCSLHVSRLPKFKPKYWAWKDYGIAVSWNFTLGRIWLLRAKLQCWDLFPFIEMFRDISLFAIQVQKVLRDLSRFNSTRGVGNEGCM